MTSESLRFDVIDIPLGLGCNGCSNVGNGRNGKQHCGSSGSTAQDVACECGPKCITAVTNGPPLDQGRRQATVI